MGSNYSSKYSVDIVMCIDVTGSMGPLINMVKENALGFYDDLIKKLAEKDKMVNEVRVRIIAFGDYLIDGERAMKMTPFLTLPRETKEFESLIRSLEPNGGGDDPEDGLEALGFAIKSKWNNSEGKKRHVIVVWSDEGTHELGFGASATGYPSKMAKSFAELSQWWGVGGSGVMDRRSKRLLIYAPAKPYWTTIATTWDNALLFPSEAGKGLDDRSYGEIMNAICNSI